MMVLIFVPESPTVRGEGAFSTPKGSVGGNLTWCGEIFTQTLFYSVFVTNII